MIREGDRVIRTERETQRRTEIAETATATVTATATPTGGEEEAAILNEAEAKTTTAAVTGEAVGGGRTAATGTTDGVRQSLLVFIHIMFYIRQHSVVHTIRQ